MFLHNLKYELISTIRFKDRLFWIILFPIILGAFFKAAFSGIYDNVETFSAMPVAVVGAENDQVLHSMLDSIENSDEPLLKVTYSDEDEALDALVREDILGIIYAGDKLSLTVGGSSIETTVLSSFVEQYNANAAIITQCAKNDPSSIPAVTQTLSEKLNTCREIPVTDGNTDYFTQYFYNLIAMVALYGSFCGIHITINSQANLSPLGARKCCSPTHKSVSMLAALVGNWLIQSLCMIISVTYVVFVLRVDMKEHLPLVYLAAILGGITGVSMGFFIGSLNRVKLPLKNAISMTSSMVLCFLSGLMIGDIKATINEKAPWFNKINPAAVISDSFYCLSIYDNYDKYIVKLATMVIISAIFVILGFAVSRRKKYASL